MNLKINTFWRAIIHLAFEHSIKAHFPQSNVFYLQPSRLLFLWDKLALGKDGRSPLKKSATKLQSHDATLPVVTSAPLFHLALLLGGSCHIRRRIGGSFPPPSPPFPYSSSWQGGKPHTKASVPGAWRGAPLEGKQFGN